MEANSIPILLVTANVGSVFEDPTNLLKIWIKEFIDKVNQLRPQFLALHLQEVGGKTYEKSMEHVQIFIQALCENLVEYNRIRIYLDEDYQSAEHFTALGNVYFIHQTLTKVKIWNFVTHDWENADGKSIHTGNIEEISTKEKSKFPQHFFPECKWSRKGFLRTRWELNSTVIDLVNIHLFHDASNLAACEQFPSVYCKTRRRALVHTLERFHIDSKNGFAPYFVFGDFNFRCDTEGVIKKLTEDLIKHRIQNAKHDSTKLQYKNTEGENVLTIGKKEFTHSEHQTKFKEPWLQQFDRELEPLREILVEYPITFAPSYPFEEDPSLPENYMSTRCPAWCDRIVMNPTARDLIIDETFSATDYNVIGKNVCMGDHKPVYLSVHIKALQGTVRCCDCYKHVHNSSSQAIQLASDHKDFILKQSFIINENLSGIAIPKFYCLYNSKNFFYTLLECCKLDSLNVNKKLIKSRIDSLKNLHQNLSSLTINSNIITAAAAATTAQINENNRSSQTPSISINITDTDNSNICLCSISSRDDINNLIDGTICTKCQNIIRNNRTLEMKRLLLSNDIIVNRIDTQYLNTTNLDDNFILDEPYTPESAESRSPCPEMDEIQNVNDLKNITATEVTATSTTPTTIDTNLLDINYTTIENNKHIIIIQNNVDDIDGNNKNVNEQRGVVSPVQLKSRLENLQKSSLNNETASLTDDVDNVKRKRFKKWCCVIF